MICSESTTRRSSKLSSDTTESNSMERTVRIRRRSEMRELLTSAELSLMRDPSFGNNSVQLMISALSRAIKRIPTYF